jgi:transcriptional regulator with XRE-family HTH domain
MEKIEKLRDICQKYNIALVYIFGSQKENSLKLLNGEKVDIKDPLADIDVGIVFSQDIESIPDRHKVYSNIYNDFEDLFLPYHLDLVFLQECHSVFQSEALLGICVYSISEEFKDEYEMMVLRRAADFKYVLDKYAEDALEKY